MKASHTQTGRTLLETLAVISLMGLLIIGGTAGLRWALARIQAIQLVKEVSQRSVLAETSQAFQKADKGTFSLPGFTNGRYVFTQIKIGPNAFAIHVAHIPQSVCEQVEHIVTTETASFSYVNCAHGAVGKFNGCKSPLTEANSLCQEGENTFTAVFGEGTIDTSDDGPGDFTPHNSNCPTAEIIPCGKMVTYSYKGETCTRYEADCELPGHCFSGVCVCPEGTKWSSEDKNCVPATECPSGYWDGTTCQACIVDSHCGNGKKCVDNTCQDCLVGQICGSCEMNSPQRPYWDGTNCICISDDTCHAYGFGACGGSQCEEICNTNECQTNGDCCAGYFCDMDSVNNSCTASTHGKCQRMDFNYQNGWLCSKKATYSKKDAENFCAAMQGHLVSLSEAKSNVIPIQTACRNLSVKLWTSTDFSEADGDCWSHVMDMKAGNSTIVKRNVSSYNVVCTGEGMWQCAKDDDCTTPENAVCHNGSCECPSNSYLQDGTCVLCDATKHQVVNGEGNGCTCGDGYTEKTGEEQLTCCANTCSATSDCCDGFECSNGTCTQTTWKCNGLCNTPSKFCKVQDSPAGNVEGACGSTEITHTCASGGVGSFYEGFAITLYNNNSWWDAWNRCDAAGLRLATKADHDKYKAHVTELVKNIAYYWLADEEDCMARYGLRGNSGNKMRKTWGNDVNANGDGNRLHGLCIRDPQIECTGNQVYKHDMLSCQECPVTSTASADHRDCVCEGNSRYDKTANTCVPCPEGTTVANDLRTCVCSRGTGTFNKSTNKCVYTACNNGYVFDEENKDCTMDWKCNSKCNTTYQYCKVGATPGAGSVDACPEPGNATGTCTTRPASTKVVNGIYTYSAQGSWYDAWNLCDSMGMRMLTTTEVTSTRKADVVAACEGNNGYWRDTTTNTTANPCSAIVFSYGYGGGYGAVWNNKTNTGYGRFMCIDDNLQTCGAGQVHTEAGECQTCPDNSTKDPDSDTCICANGETYDKNLNVCLATECPPGKTLYAGKYCLESPWKCNELCQPGYYCQGHTAVTSNSSIHPICVDGSALNPKCVKLPTPLTPYKGIYLMRAGKQISWYDAWNMCDAAGMELLKDYTLLNTYKATLSPLWNVSDRIWTGNEVDTAETCKATYAGYYGTDGAYGASLQGKMCWNVFGAFCYKNPGNCRDDQVMLDSGKCVTCPEDSTKSGNTCTCNVLGSGTYDSNINKCTYEVCALGVHLENGKCVCDGGTAFNKETKECVATTCTTPDECGCAPYQYMSSDFQCVNCELGYQPDNTQTKQVKCSDVKQSCVSCAAVDSSKPYWNDAAQQCQGCPPYQYKEGTSCKRCPSGKQANDDGTACVACSTLAENRNAECSSCAFYNPKRPYWNAFLNTCTACTLSDQIEENGTCHACPVGMELKASGACECTNGSYNEIYHKCCPTTCSTSADCCAEEGMFCNSGVCSICTGNKVLHDGACVACPAGSTAINNATECQCPAGYQWNASSATCDACPAGYYSQDNVCVECPIGNYIKNNQCLPCTKASAANCEDKPCTEQSHCGGKASQYYCRYTTTNATTDTTTGTGVCKSIGGHTEDRLPTNKRVWYSNIGNLDYWSARNWCIAFGKEPYRCDGMYTETGHDCTGSYQVNMSCPEIIGYTLPHVVYFQSYSNKRAYLSKGTYSASGAVCGGDGGWQYEMAMCQ